ncbi:DUF4365 domain-containing protein [Rheinheimera baltica]|uniref:DUF4365 domain-containing protein n=1 Tax=Rheinheimera baltica TaxID=67576 RepID=A0ABT9I397_9GAMM|nr:DUF4365 domain-containing protein [Rheinheimera baltica]MDP5137848.1 DUF4365 domain-containing protein [Rheinheimera baltica]
MAVPKNNLKELHNMSLLHPIAVAAGCTIEAVKHDFNKVDCILIGCDWDTTPQLNAQLKATSRSYQISTEEGNIKYALDAETYNKLVGNNFVPTVLVLAIIPDDENERVSEESDHLIIKGHLYWKYLRGAKTDNKSSVTIEIPLENKFSSDAIKKIMSYIDENGRLGVFQ